MSLMDMENVLFFLSYNQITICLLHRMYNVIFACWNYKKLGWSLDCKTIATLIILSFLSLHLFLWCTQFIEFSCLFETFFLASLKYICCSFQKKKRKWKRNVFVVLACYLIHVFPWQINMELIIYTWLHLQGLISGSAELREQAALGLGELIEVTSEQSLKQFVIPITGYVLLETIRLK